ncbi:MAG: amphi-Trp domain-containing protein [Halanaeroarchaeum sp.]
MPEEVLFVTETTQTRADVAGYLRTVADRLDDGAALTLSAGSDSVTLDPPGTVEFEVKAERETGGGPPEVSVEFELEWTEGREGETDGTLEIS